nr:ap-3 complex subunit beta-1 [Quercus suber]
MAFKVEEPPDIQILTYFAARDLTLEAARDVGPRKSTRPLPTPQIKKLLDSRHEREVLDGLRRVIAMQYARPSQPTLTFFPAVLKTLSNPYPSTRPLVYNYLIHHAELDPDTALLSINTIQKSLSDSDPRVRAMALKTMAGIRVPVISQIVSLAIKKGISDLSPVVRKAAALACVKCVRLDASTRPQVEEYVAMLLLDKQYYVAGAAVQAFMEICPKRLELIHPTYRTLCKMVVDMDEWGQLAVLRLMTFYARRCFPQRTKTVKRAATQEQRARDFYDDLEPQQEKEEDYEEVEFVDPDLELFLRSIQPLLQSRNSAVIVAVTRAYLYLSPSNYLHHAIGPMVALLRSPRDIQHIALYNIVQVCLTVPTAFVPYYRQFLIHSSEASHLWRLKLEALTLIFPHLSRDVQDLILAELEHFSKGHNSELIRESVRAIGRCAQASDTLTSRRCLSLLLRQIRSSDQHLVGEAIEVVRHLIQRNPDEHKQTVIRLAKNLDLLTSPTARASIIWLVGEYASSDDPEEGIAADVLRILIKGYVDEDDEVRGQILLLAAKVYLHFLNVRNTKQNALDALKPNPSHGIPQIPPSDLEEDEGRCFRDEQTSPQAQQEPTASHPIEHLYAHALLLARYTPSYDLRDRARLYRALLSVPTSTNLASLLLLAPKPVPQAPFPSEARRSLTLGSASLVIGEPVKGYEALPDWVEEGQQPDAHLRDGTGAAAEYVAAGEKHVSAGSRLDRALEADPGYRSTARTGGKERSLDAWLDEETDESEESENSDDSEETEKTDDASTLVTRYIEERKEYKIERNWGYSVPL